MQLQDDRPQYKHNWWSLFKGKIAWPGMAQQGRSNKIAV
jgi:hypothetical protein